MLLDDGLAAIHDRPQFTAPDHKSTWGFNCQHDSPFPDLQHPDRDVWSDANLRIAPAG
jgi:hypothetical protein